MSHLTWMSLPPSLVCGLERLPGIGRHACLTGVMFAGLVMLTGCLVPEKFTAKVEISPDASYVFRYSGTAVHAFAAQQLKKAGSLDPKLEENLRLEGERLMAKDPEFKKVTYKGSARYALESESKRRSGQSLKAFELFTVRTDANGVMTISVSESPEKNKRELQQLGIVINGTLEVKIPKNAEVVSSNATSTPTLGFGAYGWKIGAADQRPTMTLKFKR